MVIPSYLLLILLTAHAAYGYTIVLTSGKKTEGTLVTEQQNTIVIRDSQGVLISFKKSMLDLHAMSEINRMERPVVAPNQARNKRKSPLSIVELAAENRRRRKGTGKELTFADLDKSGGVSILGSDQPQVRTGTETEPTPVKGDWDSKLWEMKKEVNRLREKLIVAEAACEESREKQYVARTTPSKKPVGLMSTYRETPSCRKSSELATQLQEAERRFENTREEARRAGIPWQTLE